MKRLALVLALCLAPPAASAAELTTITYDLSGVLFMGTPFDMVLFSPDDPGPGGFGSRLAMEFESQGGVPVPSGSVRMKSLTLSLDLRITGLFTGWAVTRLAPGPITGGHLVGLEVFSTGTGAGTHTGLFDCVASPAACYAFCCQYATLFSGTYPLTWPTVVQFTAATTSPAPWAFNPAFSEVVATRTICGGWFNPPWGPRSCSARTGPLQVHGQEVSRTTTPEPSTLPLLLLVFAAGAGAVALRRL